jgi:hypothetical protein
VPPGRQVASQILIGGADTRGAEYKSRKTTTWSRLELSIVDHNQSIAPCAAIVIQVTYGPPSKQIAQNIGIGSLPEAGATADRFKLATEKPQFLSWTRYSRADWRPGAALVPAIHAWSEPPRAAV